MIRKAGIDLPTFCYYSELSIYGACRMVRGGRRMGRGNRILLYASRDKMKIKTNTPQLFRYGKMILELLLSSHCRDCTTCPKTASAACRSWRCGLASITSGLENTEKQDGDRRFVAIYYPGCVKCILCRDCVRMCAEIQNVGRD